MPQREEVHLDEPHEPQRPTPSRPKLRVIKGGEPLQEGDSSDDLDLWKSALAHAHELEQAPVPSPEHNEATPESLINAPYLRAAREKLVSAWADLRKYEHGLIGAARGIVARKSKETAQAKYDEAQQAYQQALREQAQEIEREFGTIEKAKALVSAMEQTTDARAEVAFGKNEISRKLYQFWQKLGELNVGNIEVVKKMLARQEDDGVWKGDAKWVGRFIARGMSLRSAVGAAMVGSGYWLAYIGWRGASAAAGGAGVHTFIREGLRVGSRELLEGSESKVRREYSEVELASMNDKELGKLMQAYGARLGFDGEKLQGNTRFERVRDAFLSRLRLVEENVQGRVDAGWDTESQTPEEERALEAMMAKKDAMLERLDGLSQKVEQELAVKEKEDRRHRLIAAAGTLAFSGAIMFLRPGGIGGAEETTPIVRTTEVPEPTPMVPAAEAVEAPQPEVGSVPEAGLAPSVEGTAVAPPVEETVATTAQEAAKEAKVAGMYTIKEGQGLLHAANEFQKSQHDVIVSGIKTQHPEWFAKGEDYAIRQWRMEQVRAHGGDIAAAGEKYMETLHSGAKIQLEFDDKGYPHLTAVEDEHITHHAEQLRPHVEAAHPSPPASGADLGFEKWGDNHPIRFSKEGVHGTLIPYRGVEGEFVLDVRDIHVDDRAMNRFLDPNFKEAIKARMHLEDDPAALAVAVEAAQTMARDVAAREAALAYLQEQQPGPDLAGLTDELHREITEILEKTNWRFEDAQVFRSVSLPPEEVGAAVGAQPVESVDADWRELQDIADGKMPPSDSIVELLKRQVEVNPATVNPSELKFPLDWTTAQQEAARRVMTYHQEMARSLQKLFDSYATDHADDPSFAQVRERLNIAQETALKHDDTDGYAVQDLLKRIAENNPGKIPTVDLVRGTSTIKDSALVESEGIFDGWVKELRGKASS